MADCEDGARSNSADGKPLRYSWSIPPGMPSAAFCAAIPLRRLCSSREREEFTRFC